MPAGRTRRKTFYGKYRGIVADNADPQGRGRLRLTLPEIFGAVVSPWAEACLPPLAGPAFGVNPSDPKSAGIANQEIVLAGRDFCCGEKEALEAGIEDATVAQFPAKMALTRW